MQKQPKKKLFHPGVNDRIVEAIREAKLTDYEAAKKAGFSYPTIYNITKGRTNPARNTVEKLAPVLRRSVEYLLTGREPGGQVVKETSAEYPERGEIMTTGEPTFIHQAIQVISTQMAIPEAEVLQAICDLAKKKLAEAKSKAG